jgi:hypothetical protein
MCTELVTGGGEHTICKSSYDMTNSSQMSSKQRQLHLQDGAELLLLLMLLPPAFATSLC